MSWMGWLRWVKNQIHVVGREPPRSVHPAPAMQRNLHRLEALLEQGAGRQQYRQRPPAPTTRPTPRAPSPSGMPAWAADAVATHFAPRPEGVPTQLVVIAVDASNRPVRNYTGTAHLISTVPATAHPGDYTFTAEDCGGHPFSVTLSTAGRQTVAAADAASNSAAEVGNPSEQD